MIRFAEREARRHVDARISLTDEEFEKGLRSWAVDRAIAERISTHLYRSAVQLAVAYYRRLFTELLRTTRRGRHVAMFPAVEVA